MTLEGARLLLACGVQIGGRSWKTPQISTDDGRERGPCRIWTDRNAQGEDGDEDQTVPLRFRNLGKRPVNRTRNSYNKGDLAGLRYSDLNAIETAKL